MTAVKLCQECHITKAFPLKKMPTTPEFGRVSVWSDKNEILSSIFEKMGGGKFKKGDNFLVFPDSGRFKIYVTDVMYSLSGKSVAESKMDTIVNIRQYLMHYSETKNDLVAVSVRLVQLVL